MTPITSILVGTDFSLEGINAVRRAALLARSSGARLKLVHALDPAGCRALREWFSAPIDMALKVAQARHSLRRLAAEIAGHYDVSACVEVVVGEPFEALLQASAAADLLVLGHRVPGRLGTWVGGGTAERLIRLCRLPVLVVRLPASAEHRQVIVPVDFTEACDAAVRWAVAVARGGRVQVFHAVQLHREAVLRNAALPDDLVRESRLRREAGALARMRRQVVRLGLGGTRMGFAVGSGHPVWATLHQARRLGADLVVTGKQGRSTLGEFLLGSVSRRVLAEANSDVLIVPRPRPVPAGPPIAPAGRAHPAQPAPAVALARAAAALAGASAH